MAVMQKKRRRLHPLRKNVASRANTKDFRVSVDKRGSGNTGLSCEILDPKCGREVASYTCQRLRYARVRHATQPTE